MSSLLRFGAARLLTGIVFSSVFPIACGSSGSDATQHAAATAGTGNGAAGSGAVAAAGGGATSESVAGSAGVANTSPGPAKEHIGDIVFDESQVQSYYLTFSDAEYAKLMDFSTLLKDPWTVNEERYVEASLRFGDTTLPSIGVRFKGNYSIWGCVDYVTKERVKRVEPFFGNIDVCQRFSLKLDFNRHSDDLRLDGLKKLNLHAMAADPSKMRERLGYSLFREMNIVAPRAVHARLFINGQYQGVFAAVEDVDGRFTANRFGDAGDGNLYRDLWPDSATTVADMQDALRTNDDPGVANVADFTAFRDAVVASTAADFAEKLAPYVDFDQLARYIVVDRAINNFDGIMSFYFGSGWGPNNQNYYWYDIGNGRFTLMPWDLDKAFWYPEPNLWSDNAPNGANVVPNWNVVTDSCHGYLSQFDAAIVTAGVVRQGSYEVREIDCDPFLRLLRGTIYDRQKAIADAFIAGPFAAANVAAKLEAWRLQVVSAMTEDPTIDAAQWQTAIEQLNASVPNFHANLSLMMSGLIHE
ncbi:MAG TPA: CotH kinase family protein [Polyangiaceae bacterium]